MKKIILQDSLLASFKKYCGILLRPDVQVFMAGTAEEMLSLHEAERASLILMDINMPRMGGDKLCSTIRQDPALKKAYVILVCAGTGEDLLRCESSGANAYLERPPEPEKLYKSICGALDLPERRGLRVLVKVSVNGKFKKEPFYCLSRDISVSGILLETEKALAKGDEVSCLFYLPNVDRVEAEGSVVRINATSNPQCFNYGVEFDSLLPGPKAAIEAFVRRATELTADEVAAITAETIREFLKKKEEEHFSFRNPPGITPL